MSECVRESTDKEKREFIIAVLERGGYNMQPWERNFLLEILNNAYDVDKVVERLEAKKYTEICLGSGLDVAFSKAIEIVKSGKNNE